MGAGHAQTIMTWDEIRTKCMSPDASMVDFHDLKEIGAMTTNPEGKDAGKLGHSVTRSNGITYYWIGQSERWLVGPKLS